MENKENLEETKTEVSEKSETVVKKDVEPKKSNKKIVVIIIAALAFIVVALSALVGGYLLISGNSNKTTKIEHISAKKYVGYWYKYSNDIDSQYIYIKDYDDDSITFDWHYDSKNTFKDVKAEFKSRKVVYFDAKGKKIEGKIKLNSDGLVITIIKSKVDFLSKGQTINLNYQYDEKLAVEFTKYKRNKDYKDEKNLVANYVLTELSPEFLKDKNLDDNEKINLSFVNSESKTVKYEKIDMFKDLEINEEDDEKTITINEKEYEVLKNYLVYNYSDVNEKYKELFNLELPKETILTDYADYLYDEESETFVEYINEKISETKNYGIVESRKQSDKLEVTVAMFNLDSTLNIYYDVKNSDEDGTYYYYSGSNYKEEDFVNYMLDNLSSRLDKVTFVFVKNEDDEYYLESVK